MSELVIFLRRLRISRGKHLSATSRLSIRLSVCLSVCLSAYIGAAPTERIFVKFDIGSLVKIGQKFSGGLGGGGSMKFVISRQQ